MRPCTLRIAPAEDDPKATSLTAALVEHAPWCRTAPNALPIRIKPLEPEALLLERVGLVVVAEPLPEAGPVVGHELDPP